MLVLVLVGCSGDIDNGEGVSVPGGAVGMGGTGSGAGGSGAVAGTGGPGGGAPGAGNGAPVGPNACVPRLPQRLVLLSDLQHANSVGSALGEAARDPAQQLSADTKPFCAEGNGRLDLARA